MTKELKIYTWDMILEQYGLGPISLIEITNTTVDGSSYVSLSKLVHMDANAAKEFLKDTLKLEVN